MFVASRVEGKAVAAELPQVVGHVRSVIGCATLTRACGIAVPVVVGDPVCLGDVIETASDGRIGIRFIDGTVFNIFSGARVVLDEFVCDSCGVPRSALFAVTAGAFAFRAGQVASIGSLRIDTPVGSIRGRAHSGGFGLLSLAALTFSMMTDARAADPNATLLDDDSITYKDLAHGAFELVTKEATPRHIIVDDPGQTVVLSGRGSSVIVNQFTNSDARMEELHAAQQDLLANLAMAGTSGSSAPPFSNPQELLLPINFIQSDSPAAENSLPLIEAALIKVPEIFIAPPPPPPTVAISSIGGQIAVAADNIINAAKANAGVEITGKTSGVEDGRVVTVTIVDSSHHVVYSGAATVTGNTWLINVTPAEAKALVDGIYTLTANVSNAAGNSAEASQAIKVDETPPTVAINTIAYQSVVNVNAASAGFAITGTTFDAESGQPVTVKIIDSSGHVVHAFTTAVINNTWSVSVSSTDAKLLHDGSYTVTADVSDAAGNPAPRATQAITVDETPPTVTWLPQAECGVEGAMIALGTITATVNSLPGHSNSVQSLVVSGIPVGAVLTDGTNSFMATSGNTSIDVKSWSLSNLKITPPNDTNFILTITATDQDANSASATELVTVAPLPPDLNPVAAHGNENTAIALDLGVTVKSLSGVDGDALPNSLNTLVVSDIPVGTVLSDGSGLPGHSFTATAGNTSHDVAGWNLSSLKITPPAEFEGCFTLTIAATERDSEGNISATATATEVVTVAPVAEPPTASAPPTLTLNENNTCVAIAGVRVGPLAEDNDDTVSATLTVSHGTLHVGWLSGVTVAGDDCATLTLSGSAAAVNKLLAELTYTPTKEYEGGDTLHLSVTSSDGSNTYPTAATASTAITVNPVAAPPTACAPATLTLDENDTCVPIAGVRVGPLAEDNDDTVSATLTVSHGTLHVGWLSGVTVAGDDCATLTLSGSAAAVNKLLAGLTYTPTTEYEGSDTLHLSVTSSDGSNTYPTAATASTAIRVIDDDERDDFHHMDTGTQVVSDPPGAPVLAGGALIDFALAATAENVVTVATTNAVAISSQPTTSNAGLDATWTPQATIEQFSFETIRNVGTDPTSEAAILSRVGLTTDSFTFDQMPVQTNVSPTMIADAALQPPKQTITSTDVTAPNLATEPSLAGLGSHSDSGTGPDHAGLAVVVLAPHDLMV
ncbi:Ig-like domain-containing protein [Bradyrhizobium erythrophlei]|uniref:Ig-like domain-containing protein n=1 Tax=Bradyrhizobium erythrophlei TaxID=1437360 RepID=UPI0035EB2E52